MSETNGYVLIIHSDATYTIKLVEGDLLPVIQDAVGGYIERMPLPKDLENEFQTDCFANEEGLIKSLPYNGIATALYQAAGGFAGAIVVGDIVFAKRKGLDSTGFAYDEALRLSERIQKGVRNV